MRVIYLSYLTLFCGVASGEELRVLGPAPRSVEALPVGGQRWVVDREMLRGATAAEIVCGEARRALIVGDDRDAGVLLLWADCPDAGKPWGPALPHDAHVVRGAVETRVQKAVDSASFGAVYRLKTEKRFPREGAPAADAEGRRIGWYTTRMVDGSLCAFVLPGERWGMRQREVRMSVSEWNEAWHQAFEDAYARGMAYLWVEDFEGAEFYLRKAVEARPDDAQSWFHLGFVRGKRGRAGERQAAYERALRFNPDLVEAHFNLGVVSVMGGRMDAAKERLADLYRLQSPLSARLAGLIDLVHIDALPR
jgi:hypothetical protein